MFEADAAQLERALANVLENSMRYAGDEPVPITAQRIGPELSIRVADRGPGIPRAELERIFEPFHPPASDGGHRPRARDRAGFVEANGGELRAQSLPGQGTTFAIQLPARAERGRRPR